MHGEVSEAGVSRRGLLAGAAGVGLLAGLGGVGYALTPDRWKWRLGIGHEDYYVPTAPEGQVRVEKVMSEERGQEVDFFTAVPAGHGDGAGLPVVVVLHGGSGRPPEYQGFGFGQFVTQAVRDGAEPFVLAGADGDSLRWEPSGNDNPQGMVVNEIPHWLADRGYDADRRVLWGWSMGGYGVLRLAESFPDYARAVAAFSPALVTGDSVYADADALADMPLGIWCGTEDMFYDEDRAFVAALPSPPQIVSYSPGAHTRTFWNDHTLAAFAFLAEHLAR